ncbi:MAG: hypothetical protein LBR80_18940 [Deltaproteobacteria bacterium]|nr:hypothetical protein [Deltaproteobacteria bacterium]
MSSGLEYLDGLARELHLKPQSGRNGGHRLARRSFINYCKTGLAKGIGNQCQQLKAEIDCLSDIFINDISCLPDATLLKLLTLDRKSMFRFAAYFIQNIKKPP